jgi:hypothetical protein
MTMTDTAARPVSHDDPAGFYACQFVRDADACIVPNPDYGSVFWEVGGAGRTVYTFNRGGSAFACWTEAGPVETLIVQGRAFKVAGPTAGQARLMAVAA